MFKNLKFSPNLAKRFGMLIAISSIVVLAAACGSSVTPPATQAPASGNTAATLAPVAAATQVSLPASSSSNSTDACILFTKDNVSTALGVPVLTATSSGMGGVCTYTTADLSIIFSIAGHTGGMHAMAIDLQRLGALALVVPGLGDQAFYNTNPDTGSPLFLLKGDAEYSFSIGNLNYTPTDPVVVQAAEKKLAVQLLSNLH